MSRLAFSHSKRIVDVRRGYFIVFPLGARVPRFLLELFSFTRLALLILLILLFSQELVSRAWSSM